MLTLAGPVCVWAPTQFPSQGCLWLPIAGACLSQERCLVHQEHLSLCPALPPQILALPHSHHVSLHCGLEAGKHWAVRSTEGLDSPSSLHMEARLPCRS